MASMNEQIVREYFEMLGFFVNQPGKYQVAARKKTAVEEIDMLVSRPEGVADGPPSDGLWGSAELRRVSCALVSVRGWHTDRFSPAVLEKSPELFRFADADVIREAGAFLDGASPACILCISDLPASRSLQRQVLGTLHARGVNGIVLFPDMLRELAAGIDVKHNYEKSDVLQLLRILKNYDLLREPQLELFTRRRKGSRS